MQSEEFELFVPSEGKDRKCPNGHSGATFTILRKRESPTNDAGIVSHWYHCPICTPPWIKLPESDEKALRYIEHQNRRLAAIASLNQYERRVLRRMEVLMRRVNKKLVQEMERLTQDAK